MKSMVKPNNKGEFYLLGYATYIIYYFYIRSGYASISFFSFLSKGLRLLCLVFLAIHVLINNKINFSWKSAVFFGLFIIVSVYSYLGGGYSNLIFVCAFIFLGITVDFNSILNIGKNTIIASLLFVFLSCKAGIIRDNVYTHSVLNMDAHTWGFNYYSFPQTMITTCIFIILFQKGKRCKYRDYIVALLVSYISYQIFTTRVCFYGVIIMVFLLFMVNNLKILQFKKKIWKYFVSIIYFAMCGLTVFSTIFYNSFNEHWRKLNGFLSGRLRMLERAYAEYDINMLGQKVVNIGNVEKALDASLSGSIYIDCGYMYSLFAYGIIFTLLVLMAYTNLFRKAYKQRDVILCIWLLVLSIMNVINNYLVSPVSNPLLILAFAVTFDSMKKSDFRSKFSQRHGEPSGVTSVLGGF